MRGDTIDIRISYEEYAVRVEFWGDEIENLSYINPTSGETLQKVDEVFIYPSKHFVLPEERIAEAVERIQLELDEQVEKLRSQGKLLEAQRLQGRTKYDIELMQEIGFCPGIENYSAPLANRAHGEPPETLFDFFPKDFHYF